MHTIASPKVAVLMMQPQEQMQVAPRLAQTRPQLRSHCTLRHLACTLHHLVYKRRSGKAARQPHRGANR